MSGTKNQDVSRKRKAEDVPGQSGSERPDKTVRYGAAEANVRRMQMPNEVDVKMMFITRFLRNALKAGNDASLEAAKLLVRITFPDNNGPPSTLSISQLSTPKTISTIEIRGGDSSWSRMTPAYMLVHDGADEDEPRTIYKFAGLDGCLVENMVIWSRNVTVRSMITKLAQDQAIAVHVNKLIIRRFSTWPSHFDDSIRTVLLLAGSVRGLELIVWEDFDDKKLRSSLSSLVLDSSKFVHEMFTSDGDYVERRLFFPAPLHLHIDYESQWCVRHSRYVHVLHGLYRRGGNLLRVKNIFRAWVESIQAMYKYKAFDYFEGSDALKDFTEMTFVYETGGLEHVKTQIEELAVEIGASVTKADDGTTSGFVAKKGIYELRGSCSADEREWQALGDGKKHAFSIVTVKLVDTVNEFMRTHSPTLMNAWDDYLCKRN